MKRKALLCFITVILCAGSMLYGCGDGASDGGQTHSPSSSEAAAQPQTSQAEHPLANLPIPMGQASQPPVSSQAPTRREGVYIDENMGFEITPLVGWTVTQDHSTRVLISTNLLAPGLAELFVDYRPGYTAASFVAQADSIVGEVADSLGTELEIINSVAMPVASYQGHQLSFCFTYPDGQVYYTIMYVLDGYNNDCYLLYYGIGKDMSADERYIDQAETMISSIVITGANISSIGQNNAPPTTPVIPLTPVAPVTPVTPVAPATDTDDFVALAGVLFANDVASTYGSNYIEEQQDGMLLYQYTNLNLVFSPDYYGQYVLTAVGITKANSPVTVGGTTVGMLQSDVHAALLSNGYEQNTAIGNGTTPLYYEGYDDEELVFVIVDLEGGAATMIRGVWGLNAEASKEAAMNE